MTIQAQDWGAGQTLREALAIATNQLEAQGVSEARNNAELLLLHILEMDRAALLFRWQEHFPEQKREAWAELLQRKAAGEPLQYITGSQWFYGREFAVAPAVLIPRPETELLVEAVLEAVDELWPQAAGQGEVDQSEMPMVIDIGTGSGAIAVTLAAERPRWHVCASDLSPDALDTARLNASRHGAGQIAWRQGDLLAPFLPAQAERLEHAGMPVGVLVSNPPYIPAADMAELQREVRDFEPHLALEGGADGLDPYRRMLETIARLQEPPRIVAFELGIHQPRIVAALMERLGYWNDIRIIADYAGIERHILAKRK